jgi:hypothetical protein
MKPVIKKNSKRAQVDKDKTKALIAIGVASVVLVAGFMISKALWSQASYIGKVIDKKEVAVEQLKANKEAVDQLKTSYDDFVTRNPNLIGGSVSGEGQNDGDNSKLVLDALPSEYDFPALVSSVEGLLSVYKIKGIEGVDDSVIQATAETVSAPVEIPVSMSFTSTYDDFKNSLNILKRSIRPFKITKIELSGTNSQLDSEIGVITYYQPATGLKIESEAVN